MEQENSYEIVATKVRKEAKDRLEALCKSRGMTKYDLLQMMCDTLIRYMDDHHNLTPEMEKAMSVFEHMNGWKDALNLADPTVEPEVAEATYYITSKGKKGCRAVHVFKPFMGKWTQTENIQDIIERNMSYTMPERYSRLRDLAYEMDCTTVLQLLDLLIDAHSVEALNAELRKDFEDADRSDWGKKPVESPYKRKHHKDPDTLQQTIVFDEEDKKAAAREGGVDDENELGFRPFGVEY
jgi:hypothetical protein